MRHLGADFIEPSLASPLRSRHLSPIAPIRLLSEQKDGRVMRPFAARILFSLRIDSNCSGGG